MDLSAIYLDVLKDRLYCSSPDSPLRRSAQTALHRLARMLATAMAPLLPFTADEVWDFLPGATPGRVHLETFDLLPDVPEDDAADAVFARLLDLRDEILKELEIHRQAGEFGKSLEAEVVLGGDLGGLDSDLASCRTTLEELCIVSQVTGGEGSRASQVYPGLSVGVRRVEGTTCPRCWQVWPKPAGHASHPELCARCLDVVLGLEKQSR